MSPGWSFRGPSGPHCQKFPARKMPLFGARTDVATSAFSATSSWRRAFSSARRSTSISDRDEVRNACWSSRAFSSVALLSAWVAWNFVHSTAGRRSRGTAASMRAFSASTSAFSTATRLPSASARTARSRLSRSFCACLTFKRSSSMFCTRREESNSITRSPSLTSAPSSTIQRIWRASPRGATIETERTAASSPLRRKTSSTGRRATTASPAAARRPKPAAFRQEAPPASMARRVRPSGNPGRPLIGSCFRGRLPWAPLASRRPGAVRP